MALGYLILTTFASIASAAPATANGRAAEVFRDRIRHAGFYLEPEFPAGCLDWKEMPEGEDSLWMAPLVSRSKRCDRIRMTERWIMARDGGLPLLATGTRFEVRTPMDLISQERPSSWTESVDEPESEVDSYDGSIDVILAGGSGKVLHAKSGPSERATPAGTDTPTKKPVR